MVLRDRFPHRRSMSESDAQAFEDIEARQPKTFEISKVTAIMLLVGLACLPITFAAQSYLSVSTMLLLFIFCFYIIPIYMMAAAQLLVLVIGDETGHKQFRACSA